MKKVRYPPFPVGKCHEPDDSVALVENLPEHGHETPIIPAVPVFPETDEPVAPGCLVFQHHPQGRSGNTEEIGGQRHPDRLFPLRVRHGPENPFHFQGLPGFENAPGIVKDSPEPLSLQFLLDDPGLPVGPDKDRHVPFAKARLPVLLLPVP